MIDILLLAVLGVVAYLAASEGAWGAAVTFVSAVLSGLLAMNLFEPLADSLSGTFPSAAAQSRLDVVCLVGLFAGGVALFRRTSEMIQKVEIPVEGRAYDAVRWLCGVAAGYVVAAFFLTALHTAPLPPGALGFEAERDNMLGDAPDRRWLGYVQYLSEKPYARRDAYGRIPVFDGPQYAVLKGGEPRRWSSFPIRYKTRRRVDAGLITAPTAARAAPSGGGASGNSGF